MRRRISVLLGLTVFVALAPRWPGALAEPGQAALATPMPEIDPASVVLWPDDGRLELRGQHLDGMRVVWEGGGRRGQDACLDPAPSGKGQQCVIPVGPKLPASAVLYWLPAGARAGDAATVLHPARTIYSTLLPPAVAVDVSQGPGRVPLLHPGAVSGVDCSPATCEIQDGALVVWSAPALASTVTARIRLAPRVYLARGSAQESVVNETLPLFHCPLSLVSGAPFRDADENQLIVRMDQQDERCGKNPRLRWVVNGESAEPVRTVKSKDASFVQLRVARITGDRVTVLATRADVAATTIASVTATTVALPRPRATLELPLLGKVEFIPTNRSAVLTVAGAGEHTRLIPLSVEGAYEVVGTQGKGFLVRGDENAGGFVSLRFGLRMDDLPREFAGTDLAVVTERIVRAVREASVPAPLASSAEGDAPIIEFVCAGPQGNPWWLPPGRANRIPFEARDTCRIVIHRERLRAEDGLQEIILEVDVTRADGSARGDLRLNERMVLRPGADPKIIPVRAGASQFDQIVVRVSHVLDETRYALNPVARNGVPTVQWSASITGGRFRLYATVAIPAGLYRVNEPSGQLTLNFGVLSRITTLNPHGKEGLLGAELGLMGVGLIQSPGAIGHYPPTIASVAGFGLRVPLAGGSASVNVHAWVAYEFRRDFDYMLDAMSPKQQAPHWGFIFGPSISIGNVGTNF